MSTINSAGFYHIFIIKPTQEEITDHISDWYVKIESDGSGKEYNYMGQMTYKFSAPNSASTAIEEAGWNEKLQVKYIGQSELWDLFEPSSQAPEE